METQNNEVEHLQIKVKTEVKDVIDVEEEEGPPPGYQTILSLPKLEPTDPLPIPPPPQPLALQTILSFPKPEPDPLPQPQPQQQQQQNHTLTQQQQQQLKAPKLEPSLPLPPQTTTTNTTTPLELGQMVCGSCRRLLKYPLGATQVQCLCCQIVNFVLEAHQVGQVKCGSCTLLLMYPYGAPQVRCCSCQFVTEIGANNQRPPWSVQQGQPVPCPNRPK